MHVRFKEVDITDLTQRLFTIKWQSILQYLIVTIVLSLNSFFKVKERIQALLMYLLWLIINTRWHFQWGKSTSHLVGGQKIYCLTKIYLVVTPINMYPIKQEKTLPNGNKSRILGRSDFKCTHLQQTCSWFIEYRPHLLILPSAINCEGFHADLLNVTYFK